MKKQNIAIIGVVAFILAVAVGYALFSESIQVNGTAKASATFDYEFTSVGEITKVGYTETKETGLDGSASNMAVISSDKNTLTVTINKLDYPGAYVEIPVTITNAGTISGKLKSIEESGINSADTMLKVSYTGVAASETVIAPNETQNMTIRVEWPSDYNFADATNNTVEETVQFSIKLNYEQAQ